MIDVFHASLSKTMLSIVELMLLGRWFLKIDRAHRSYRFKVFKVFLLPAPQPFYILHLIGLFKVFKVFRASGPAIYLAQKTILGVLYPMFVYTRCTGTDFAITAHRIAVYHVLLEFVFINIRTIVKALCSLSEAT
jgi:hypothetical protein